MEMNYNKMLKEEEIKGLNVMKEIMTYIKKDELSTLKIGELYLEITDKKYIYIKENSLFYKYDEDKKCYKLILDATFKKKALNYSYFIKDVREIFERYDKILNKILNKNRVDENNNIINNKNIYLEIKKYLNNASLLIKVIDEILIILKTEDKYIKEKINDNIQDLILYNNGNLNLNTFELKERDENDLYTNEVILNYNFIEEDKINKEYYKEMKEMIKHTANDDEELYKYIINCISGGLTRRKNDNYFFNYTGVGGNGKTFILELLSRIFEDKYVSKLNNDLILLDTSKSEKSKALSYFNNKCLCLGYFDEVGDNNVKLDIGILKTLTGNENIKTNQLYTKEQLNIILKTQIYIITNSILNFNSESNGVSLMRRGRVIEFNNIFHANKNEYEEFKEEKGHYLANPSYIKNLTEEHKQAFIYILKEGFNNYYKNNCLILDDYEPSKEEMKNLIKMNNPINDFINKYYDLYNKNDKNNNENDFKESFDDMFYLYKEIEYKGRSNITKRRLYQMLKGVLNYKPNNSKKQYNGKTSYGIVYGIKIKNDYKSYLETRY